ncbi:MAG: copper-binding protein [Pseudomonadota bacterium]
MKLPIRSLLALSALALGGYALAQAPATEGEVRKIDTAQQKITLKHGEIKNLDMPPMTMAFRVKDPSVLGRLAVGDRVKFSVEKIDGAYTVTSIQKAN